MPSFLPPRIDSPTYEGLGKVGPTEL